MKTQTYDNLEITEVRRGADRFAKVSYPIRYGRFTEIKTADHVFQFDLNGRIKFINGLNDNWPHPAEWLKRTAGNDWVYYSTGGYAGVVEAIGEYYLPNLRYPTNALIGGKPFREKHIHTLVSNWYGILNQMVPDLVTKEKELEDW